MQRRRNRNPELTPEQLRNYRRDRQADRIQRTEKHFGMTVLGQPKVPPTEEPKDLDEATREYAERFDEVY